MIAPGLVAALMHHRVLIPEGRSEYEWFRLLSYVIETGDIALDEADTDTPAFGTVIGVVPTHDGAVGRGLRGPPDATAWIGSSRRWG